VHGFIRGIGLGTVVAAGGLVVVSQLSPPVQMAQPSAPMAETAAVQPSTAKTEDAPAAMSTSEGTKLPDAQPDALPQDSAPEVATAPEAAVPSQPDVSAPAPAAEPAPLAEPATPPSALQPVAPATQTPPLALSTPPEGQDQVAEAARPNAPDALRPAAPEATSPALPAPSQSDTAAVAPATPSEPPAAPPSEPPAALNPQAKAASAAPLAPETSPGDLPAFETPHVPGALPEDPMPRAAELPPPPPLTPEEEALLTPLPEALPVAPAQILPDTAPEAAPELAPQLVPEAAPLPTLLQPQSEPLAPVPGLKDQAAGVVTNRLPHVGSEAAAVPAAEPAQADDSLPPLKKYARAFENPEAKPLFAILLIDDGSDSVDRAELAALSLPLSIVIDPMSNDAEQRAEIWRKGGQEVIMAASGVPAGATPADLEQTFEALGNRLPEAVAVIDANGKTFQDNRTLSSQIVAILQAQGKGVVSYDAGLNAADQVARREGLPSATLFRNLDAAGEGAPVIRRYLDRAAFKAAQEGHVAVIGTLRPQTVQAILEWSIEGRAATMALAPISALLK
jgi:uncharacterized protein